jgi:acetylornithine deacetylase/succinyl-diaminopimelate desuccinylase-like protein
MTKLINDPAIKIDPLPLAHPPSPPSRLDTEMYRVLEQVSKKMFPGATVLPTMSTGASDKAQSRVVGIQSYGIGPAGTEEDNVMYGAHSDVERLPESSLYQYVEFTWNVVTQIAAHR